MVKSNVPKRRDGDERVTSSLMIYDGVEVIVPSPFPNSAKGMWGETDPNSNIIVVNVK